jgi:hypothetical protein
MYASQRGQREQTIVFAVEHGARCAAAKSVSAASSVSALVRPVSGSEARYDDRSCGAKKSTTWWCGRGVEFSGYSVRPPHLRVMWSRTRTRSPPIRSVGYTKQHKAMDLCRRATRQWRVGHGRCETVAIVLYSSHPYPPTAAGRWKSHPCIQRRQDRDGRRRNDGCRKMEWPSRLTGPCPNSTARPSRSLL